MQQVRIYGKFITYKNKRNKRTCGAAEVFFRVLPDKKTKKNTKKKLDRGFLILYFVMHELSRRASILLIHNYLEWENEYIYDTEVAVINQ